MKEQFERTELLLGIEAVTRLQEKRVAVFGIGGVGGIAAEALVRSGIGAIDLIDKDEISVTNINRQIIATHKTVGMSKVQVMRERLLDINPDCKIIAHECFFLPETADQFCFLNYDYIIDAVDTVTAKLELVMQAEKAGIPIISSMGAGNKLDASRFEVADIAKTSVCPLARVMRKELKKRNIFHLKVVYSKEEPLVPKRQMIEEGRRALPGSVAFVPPVAGLLLAGEVIRDLTEFG